MSDKSAGKVRISTRTKNKKSRTGTQTGRKTNRSAGSGKRRKSSKKKKKGFLSRIKVFKYKPKTLHIIIAVAAIALLIIVPRLRNSAGETGAKVPKGAFSYMLDISHYQNSIQWDSLRIMTDSRDRTISNTEKARRIKKPDYIIIKASEGTKMRDRTFQSYWKEAGAAGYRRGAYHFFHANKNIEEQVANFTGCVSHFSHKDFGPVLDVEIKPASMSTREFNARILQWLKAVEKHYKRKPVIYAPDSFVMDYFSEEVLSYPVWVAHYKCEKPVYTDWQYWQFTDKAVVYGIEGKVDLNVIR